MKTRMRITDASGKIVLSTLTESELALCETGQEGVLVVPGGKVRVGYMESSGGSIFLSSNDPDLVKSSRAFKKTMEIVSQSFSYLRAEVIAAEERAATKSRRLIHNLTSLNGHMIQELYSAVPQERLAGNIKRNIPFLMAEMKGVKGKDFAKCFLSLAKHSAAMKNEFSVFKKIDSLENRIDKRQHVAHKIVMNVAYLFFSDFADKGSYVEITDSELRAPLDYECAFTAIYHLFDNAAKYICPHTDLSVDIRQETSHLCIAFTMCSLAINTGEVATLMKEGVSGDVPKRLGLSGDGVGLHLIRRVMDLHGGDFVVGADSNSAFIRDGVAFQKNSFTLVFPSEK